MDVNKKYKRKLSDRDPQDQFGRGTPDDGCADNGREMYPKAKERRKVFGQEIGAGNTLCRAAGTDKESHSFKQKHKKRKCTASLQVDLQVEDLVNSRKQSLLQESGTCPEKTSCVLRSEESLGLNEMTRTQSSKSKKGKKKGLQAKEIGVGKEAALQYLHLWDNNRSCWCFKKKAQFWLLQHMYEEDQVMTMC